MGNSFTPAKQKEVISLVIESLGITPQDALVICQELVDEDNRKAQELQPLPKAEQIVAEAEESGNRILTSIKEFANKTKEATSNLIEKAQYSTEKVKDVIIDLGEKGSDVAKVAAQKIKDNPKTTAAILVGLLAAGFTIAKFIIRNKDSMED